MAEQGGSTPAPDDVHLGEAINRATRSVHAKLNKLILLRLPLAVPPRAETSSLYVTGLLHLAPIYLTFESLWHRCLDAPSRRRGSATGNDESKEPSGETEYCTAQATPSQDECLPMATERDRSILDVLLIPGLHRSARLRSDILHLTGWSPALVEEQLRSVAKTGHLSAFIQHIERSVGKRPYVLLAYAWVLYMALFSGGRFIRASLESAGDHFWKELPSPIRPNMVSCQPEGRPVDDSSPEFGPEECTHWRHRAVGSPDPRSSRRYALAFFHFETPRDGEDLKQGFKKRLLEAEGLLTPTEKDHIVQEASCIFESMMLVVSQLDTVCGTSLDELSGGPAFLKSGGRLRDSIAVSKERARRAAAEREPSEAGSDSSRASSSSSASSADFVAHVEEAVADQLQDLGPGQTVPSGVKWEDSLPTPDKVARGTPNPWSKSPPSADGATDTKLYHRVAGPATAKQRWPLGTIVMGDVVVLVGLVAVCMGYLFVRS